MSAMIGIPNPATAGCCAGRPAGPTVPALITNPPGLAAIQYRIGTFTSFRQAMLNAVVLPDLLAGAVTSLKQAVIISDTQISVTDSSIFPGILPFRIRIGTEYMLVTGGNSDPLLWNVTRSSSPGTHSIGDFVTLDPVNPFAYWHPGISGDYQSMLIELWAYLSDVLTFYQERIANEAFLGTATQRDSLLRLAGLIDYHPGPGAGASGLVAFTVTSDQSVIVPAGFRVGAQVQSSQPAVVFETSNAVSLSADNSAISLAVTAPDVQFAANTLVLRGINNRLAPGDHLLAVEQAGSSAEHRALLQISTVSTDETAQTTTLTWTGSPYSFATKLASVYALRITASPFGATAPRWNALAPALTNNDGQHSGGSLSFPNNWDAAFTPSGGTLQTPNPLYYLPLVSDLPAPVADPPNVLFLDGVYSDLKYSSASPGWAALLPDSIGIQNAQILRITDARPSVKSAFSISSGATRLTFQENVFAFTFPVRTTIVLTGSELLPLQTDLPLPELVAGDTLILAGRHPDLENGRTVVFQGNVFDPANQSASVSAEVCIIADIAKPGPDDNTTEITLQTPLVNQYVRATCSVMANVAEVTQGETVKDEVLGGSDGSAFQQFRLQQSPVTYLPSTDPEGLASVQSTLNVMVSGVEWNEQPNLAASLPHAQDFTTTLDDQGQTSVVFGDGFQGARPPTGSGNIHVRYRKGSGSSGNVPAGSIQQLIDSLPNLEKVSNPMPSIGGTDPQTLAGIRTQAPAGLKTFSRAVSVIDYASIATSFPGIAKAGAVWVTIDPATLRSVHPYVMLTVAADDQSPILGTVLAAKLRNFLDKHRDPNVLLRVQDFTPAFIEVAVEIEIEDRFPHQGILNQVQAALNPGINADGSFGYFAFQRLQFGQNIYLSSVYAAVQAIDGVKDANITKLRNVGPGMVDSPFSTPHDILIGPTEIAMIDPNELNAGRLTVTGHGGFVDQ